MSFKNVKFSEKKNYNFQKNANFFALSTDYVKKTFQNKKEDLNIVFNFIFTINEDKQDQKNDFLQMQHMYILESLS